MRANKLETALSRDRSYSLSGPTRYVFFMNMKHEYMESIYPDDPCVHSAKETLFLCDCLLHGLVVVHQPSQFQGREIWMNRKTTAGLDIGGDVCAGQRWVGCNKGGHKRPYTATPEQ